MTIPIFYGGRRIGELETRREGAYTRFEARCAFLPGVRRLRVFGEGGSAALGVMRPEGEKLVLIRRFSRAAMRAFPSPIEYAGFEAERSPAPAPKTTVGAEGKTEKGGPLHVTEDGARFLALPCALRRDVPGTRVREIGGRRWMLFRC